MNNKSKFYLLLSFVLLTNINNTHTFSYKDILLKPVKGLINYLSEPVTPEFKTKTTKLPMILAGGVLIYILSNYAFSDFFDYLKEKYEKYNEEQKNEILKAKFEQDTMRYTSYFAKRIQESDEQFSKEIVENNKKRSTQEDLKHNNEKQKN